MIACNAMNNEMASPDLLKEDPTSGQSATLRLEKLVIEGFKSFASRVHIQLQPGITAIVGPNGCGKSNIVDAIRWVLGEPSAKSLRAESMQEVLFAGAQGQNPASLAQVTLELSGAHPSKPLFIDRFEIERRLFRTGESEYKLNKRQCRLRDIHELFADTGLGRNAFAIFEQGRIEQMVMMSAPQRRLLIEEAAGIAGFKIQKKEALSKWQSIDTQLKQIGQVYEELSARLVHLKEQAQKALTWQACQTEIERLVRLGHIHKWNLLNTEGQKLLSVIEKIEGELKELRKQREAAQEQLSIAETAFEKDEERLLEKRKSSQKVKEQLIEVVQSIKYLEIQLQQHTQALQKLSERLVHLNQKRDNLRLQLSQLNAQQDACQNQLEKAATSYQKHEEELESQKLEQNTLFKEKQEIEAKILEKKHQRQLFEQKRQSQKSQKEQILRQIHSYEQSLEKGRLEEQTIRPELEKILSQLEASSKALEKADEISVLKKELIEEEKLFEEEKRLLSDLELKRKDRQMRLNWLEERARSCDLSLWNWLCPQLDEPERLQMKALSPLLAQVASSEKLSSWKFLENAYLVQESLLPRLMQFLESKEAPSFALWPIPVAQGDTFEDNCQKEIKRVLALFEKEPQKYIRSWGSRKVRVDELGVIWSMDQSLSYAQILQQIPFEKEQLETEVDQEKKSSACLAQKKERIAALKAQLQSCEKQFQGAQTEHQKQRLRQENLENRLSFLKEQAALVNSNLQPLKDALSSLEQQCLEIEGKISEIGSDSSEQESLKLVLQKLQETQRKFYSARSQKEAAEKEKNQLLTNLARCQAQIASSQESFNELEQSLKVDQQAISDEKAKVKISKNAYEEARQKELLLSKESQEQGAELEKEEIAQVGLKNHIKDLQKKVKSFEGRLEQLQNKVIEERKKWDEIHWNKQGIETNIDVQEAELWDGVFISPDQIQVEITRLKTEQQELGFVNFAAAKELAQLQERHELIGAQMEDVQKSRLELMRVIAHLDEKCRQLFQETFQKVKEAFTRNFQEIFEGGAASLILSGEEDSQGVEIQASPPGKQIRALSLMSGGEKCLTAVALMMALFEVRPAPFCLLDEIDAPLDDANVTKLIRLLRHYSQRTQVFIITHNKQTMAAASTLLGVSMPKRGISQLFVLDVGSRQLQTGSNVVSLQTTNT